MTRALAHRGPDAEGFWAADHGGTGLRSAAQLDAPSTVALGHRRLSIVDLAGGAQPMPDADGRICVSYNGEIYNHLELRRELERDGHRFRTDSDTEVLVHGWQQWGERLFGRLNGIFAFALVDVPRQTIVLVRDPVGVKPLYIGVDGGLTWWSSELTAADRAALVEPLTSAAALKLFLTFRFVPSPWTIFERAWKVPPGHFVRLTLTAAGKAPAFTAYDCQIRSTASPRTRADWSEALFAELDSAITRQLMADVPVSSLLSGGVDSSLVTRMMAAHLAQPPATFGIGFRSDGDRSEALAAASAARELGVPHHTTVVADDEYLSAWPHALAQLGEPIANTGLLLVRLICERVGETHKVTLSGQGADEPLGGYPRHLVERVFGYARHLPTLSGALTGRVFGAENGERLVRALAARDRVDRYVEIFSVMPSALVDALVAPEAPSAYDLAREAIVRWVDCQQEPDAVNALLRLDARLSLADDLLIIGDLFSMRSGVELRVPFLDLGLLELLERMPSIYKVSRLGERKSLYRRGAFDLLPPALAGDLRRHGRLARKRGFSTPRAWFEGSAPARDQSPLRCRLAMPSLNAHVLEQVIARALPRQRALLASLAMWHEQHPPADARPLPVRT